MVQAAGHQAADGGGRGVEHVHPVLVHHLPEPPGIGEGGHALEHHLGRTCEQGTVGDVAVPGDPAHVRGAPEHLPLLVLEHVAEAVVGVHHVAADGVDHALGFAGASAGVEDEERVLAVHLLRRAGGIHVLQFIGQPGVTAGLHGHIPTDPPGHEHMLHRGALLQRLVHYRLHGHLLGAAEHAIAAEHRLGAGVVDAVRQAPGAEPAEHDAVDGADAGTGQHAHHEVGDHGHVHHHPVALADALGLQHVRVAADPVVQLRVGDAPGLLLGVIRFPDQGGPVPMGFHVPVQAVLRDVQPPSDEPLHRRGLELPLQHAVPAAAPGEPFRLCGPEGLGILDAGGACGRVVLSGTDAAEVVAHTGQDSRPGRGRDQPRSSKRRSSELEGPLSGWRRPSSCT